MNIPMATDGAKSRRQAPGPRGSLIMGNLADYKRDPIDMLLRLRRDHGDVVRNRIGPFLTHSLAHPDHVQYVLQDNHRNYVRGRFYERFKLFFGDGLLTTEGEFWRRHRRAVQPGFHRRQLDATAGAVGNAATSLVERWRLVPRGESIDAVPAMMHLSLAALGRMVFNADISHTAEDVGPAVRFGLEAMMPQGNHNDFIPRWAPTPFNRRVQKARTAIDRVIARVIDDHRNGSCDTSDVISLLLASRDAETGSPMTEREVHDEVMTIFLAGHETTGSGLAWALYALAQHPGVLRQLREELLGKLDGRAPTIEDLEALPYLEQVVSEALRVYPPIWGYTRDLVDDDEIGGFHVPGGSSVFLSPYVTHRHPDFWPNPEAFDPENFGSHAPMRHKYAFFPFGGGMRKCIGYQMALLIMRIVVATVAQHLDLTVVSGHPIQRGALVALRPLQGIRLAIRPHQRIAASGMRLPTDPQRSTTNNEPAEGCPFAATATRAMTQTAVVPVAASVAASIEADAALRFTWFPVEIPALPPTPAPALAGKRIIIVNGRPSSADRVAHALARCSACPHVFSPAPDADIAMAARALVQQVGAVDGIVDLGLETPFTLAGVADWEAPMQRTLGVIHACYDEWLAEESASRRFYLAVTWMDGRMGYGGLDPAAAPHSEQPLGGLWAGFAKTLPQELPNCNVRILDLAPDEADDVAQRVAAELYRWGLFEIGYSNGRRYTLQAQRSDLPTSPLSIGPGDVVLFSGGARGIGLLCARAIAERYGATVVITGREAPADGGEAWAMLDEAGFKRFAQDRLRAATPQNPVVAIRREMAQLRRRQVLRATLDAIAAQGLPIQYRVCDVTDAAAVRALCDEFGDALRVVIHNAGVDRPVRLAQKSTESFIDTVRTKVLGFANLCAAVEGRANLLRFCNVGSLTGRWGGMTGETDYAAANEALARLGLWAQRHALGCTVKTLAWPTWNGVGMITNPAVTKRYVATMANADGIRHWLAELADGRSGEVMFMGAVGAAVTPIQISGFSPAYGLPNIAELVTRHHHAGEPTLFRPFARLVTRYRIASDSAPFLHAYRVDGRPALPSAILLEHACGAGSWITPDAVHSMALVRMADVRIGLDAAIWPSGGDGWVDLRTEATGHWRGSEWRVNVVCTLTATGCEVLRVTLVYREAPVLASQEAIAAVRLLAEPAKLLAPAAVGRATWNDHLLRPAEWTRSREDATPIRIGRVAAVDASDLWALIHPPTLRLPINHIENVLRVTWAAAKPAAEEASTAIWLVESITLAPQSTTPAKYLVEHAAGHFAITDEQGLVMMDMKGVRMVAPDDPVAGEHLVDEHWPVASAGLIPVTA